MSLFKRKKRIDTVEFWKGKVEYLFSSKFDNAVELLVSTKKELLQNVDSSLLRDHIIASFVELLEVSIAKNGASRDKRYEILNIQDSTLDSYGNPRITQLVRQYNQHFGSSAIDGIRPMAHFFTLSVLGENNKDFEEFLYSLFYAVLGDSFDELETIKLN